MTDPSPPPDQAESLIEAGVAQIAATLNEHDKLPLKQIRRIVHALGLAATEAIVADALQDDLQNHVALLVMSISDN